MTAAGPFVVKVSDGSFNRDIALRFDNITATTLLNDFYVEILPLQEECDGGRPPDGRKVIRKKCIQLHPDGAIDSAKSELRVRDGYKSYLIRGEIVPFLGSASGKADPDSSSSAIASALGGDTLAKFAVDAMAYRRRVSLRSNPERVGPAEYAAENRLHYLDIDDPLIDQVMQRNPKFARAREELRRIFANRSIGTITLSEDQRPLMSVLCDVLVRKNEAYQNRKKDVGSFVTVDLADVQEKIRQCSLQPGRFLRMSRIIHVGKVDTTRPVRRLFNQQLNFAVIANFVVNRGHSFDTITSLNFKPGGFLVKILDSVGIFAILDFGQTVINVETRGKSEASIASLSDTMDVNPLGLNIPVADSRSCLHVSPVKSTTSPFIDHRPEANNGLYICDEQVKSSEVHEIYAHIVTRARDSSIVEAYDALTQTVNLSLRGDRELSAFFYQVRKGITPDHHNQIFPPEMLKGRRPVLCLDPLGRHGPRGPSRPLPGKPIPSFTERMLFQHKERFVEDQ
ncbi:MAG: hypothetical protein HC902_09345 [Calothrix sp. SM1_5_4]|nr:hypothetical protein [Calothrix sp. SM1_5_4]